jgi:hypothetical protein
MGTIESVRTNSIASIKYMVRAIPRFIIHLISRFSEGEASKTEQKHQHQADFERLVTDR